MKPFGPSRQRNAHPSSYKLLVPAVTLLLGMGCVMKAVFSPRHLSNYRGDGTISKIKFLPNPGVKVEFEHFPLSRPYRAIYRLEGLPRRPSPYWVHLVVANARELNPNLNGPIRIGIRGTLTLWSRDSLGHTIFYCSWSPEEHGWSTGCGSGIHEVCAGFLKLYGPRVQQAYILPGDVRGSLGEKLSLEVSWDPESAESKYEAWVLLRCGGDL